MNPKERIKLKIQQAVADEQDRATKTDIITLVNKILFALEKREELLKNELDSIKKNIADTLLSVREKSDTTVTELQTALSKITKDINATLDAQVKKVDLKLDEVRNGEDADEDAVTARVIDALSPLIEKDKELFEARNELEGLEGSQRLKMSAIDGLEEAFKNLEDKLLQSRSGRLGGYTDNHVKMALGRMGKTETPSGDIDGANTEYTVKQPIFFVFSFMLNGEPIPSGDYTIAGNKITFGTAIPAVYSGKDFEIKYI